MNIDTIAKMLFFATVRIDHYGAQGNGFGTGFIMTATLEDGSQCPMLVTNKHVVDGAQRLVGHFIPRKPGEEVPNLGHGVAVDLPAGPGAYVGHPDPAVDIAVMPLATTFMPIADQLFIQAIPLSLLATETPSLFVDAIEEVTFVGYPNGYRDDRHFTPIARRGITATPIELDYSGRPVFLIDGSVFGGSSGSPVFLFNQGTYQSGPNALNIGSRIVLVGIVAETMMRFAELPVTETAAATHVKVAQELNLGVAFNAQAIKEAIEHLVATAGRSLAAATPAPPAPDASTVG
ncbi:trypsin-like peptidase domain-containing protein [Streptomyces sp. NPDC059534]|uniref:trypsin-like peptidase domain-containing protein n=1 Tax=Streptomyces sp. NPDC059534 TaxID=3346859 RepID=UPI003698FB58